MEEVYDISINFPLNHSGKVDKFTVALDSKIKLFEYLLEYAQKRDLDGLDSVMIHCRGTIEHPTNPTMKRM